MLYLLTALKPEAQAFVDKFKLVKSKCENFTLHEGKNIKVIVSGVGVENAKIAANVMIKNFKPGECDIFINIGICGANSRYKIGELLEIGSIMYRNEKFILNENISHVITCNESEVSDERYNIVDMESFGFYEATKGLKNLYMYKIVSDHFEPHKVTKEKTKALIFNVIDEIVQKVKS
jgi:nucleoside phosphorylase